MFLQLLPLIANQAVLASSDNERCAVVVPMRRDDGSGQVDSTTYSDDCDDSTTTTTTYENNCQVVVAFRRDDGSDNVETTTYYNECDDYTTSSYDNPCAPTYMEMRRDADDYDSDDDSWWYDCNQSTEEDLTTSASTLCEYTHFVYNRDAETQYDSYQTGWAPCDVPATSSGLCDYTYQLLRRDGDYDDVGMFTVWFPCEDTPLPDPTIIPDPVTSDSVIITPTPITLIPVDSSASYTPLVLPVETTSSSVSSTSSAEPTTSTDAIVTITSESVIIIERSSSELTRIPINSDVPFVPTVISVSDTIITTSVPITGEVPVDTSANLTTVPANASVPVNCSSAIPTDPAFISALTSSPVVNSVYYSNNSNNQTVKTNSNGTPTQTVPIMQDTTVTNIAEATVCTKSECHGYTTSPNQINSAVHSDSAATVAGASSGVQGISSASGNTSIPLASQTTNTNIVGISNSAATSKPAVLAIAFLSLLLI